MPDTVEYACKELKTQTIIEITASGVVHEFNFDTKKNNSLIELAVKLVNLKKYKATPWIMTMWYLKTTNKMPKKATKTRMPNTQVSHS